MVMIRLDDYYCLQNNNVHGVELVFKENRIRTNRIIGILTYNLKYRLNNR